VTPGVIQAFNPGTFETRPDATIWGPINGPAITLLNTGQTVSWRNPALSMNFGDRLDIDFDARQAFLNSVYVPADIISGWFTLSPGSNYISVGGSQPITDSGVMVMSYQAAWI
jgi:hypothetical protein